MTVASLPLNDDAVDVGGLQGPDTARIQQAVLLRDQDGQSVLQVFLVDGAGPCQGGALLCAELYTGFFLFLFLIREAGVILVKLKVILHSKALQQPAHRPPLALLAGKPSCIM